MKQFSIATAVFGISTNFLISSVSFAADAQQAEPSASQSKAAPATADTAKKPAVVDSGKNEFRRDTMESTSKASDKKAAPANADTTKNPAAVESAKGGGRRDTEESTHKGSLKSTNPDEPSSADKELLAHAAKTSATLSEAQKAMLLKVVNTGETKTLTALLPSIDGTKALAIKAARPFKTVDDLILVKGMGKIPFDGIVSIVKKDGPPPWITLSGKTLSEQ